MTTTLALVGAAGGAGTTRTTLELAAALAREDRDVAVLDAAYATQGLADHVEGRIDPDVTRLCTDDRQVSDGLVAMGWDLGGRVAAVPARAPFERVARAKRSAAAQRLGGLVAAAAERADHVLLDVPHGRGALARLGIDRYSHSSRSFSSAGDGWSVPAAKAVYGVASLARSP